MTDRFNDCLRFVFAWEGLESDRASDTGGFTRFGISTKFAKSIGLTEADVKGLSREDAADIYREHFWNSAKCPSLFTGLDLVVFDTAVNMGVGAASQLLQRAAGVTADGQVGPVTLAAVAAVQDADRAGAVNLFTAYRVLRYAGLSGFGEYGLGWVRRAQAALVQALADRMRIPV